jgi:hypothetical protein
VLVRPTSTVVWFLYYIRKHQALTYSQFHASTFHETAVELLSTSAASELLGLGIQFLHKIQRQASFFLALHLVRTETALGCGTKSPKKQQYFCVFCTVHLFYV